MEKVFVIGIDPMLTNRVFIDSEMIKDDEKSDEAFERLDRQVPSLFLNQEEMKCLTEMLIATYVPVKAVQELTDYCYEDELRNFEEAGKPKLGHIFLRIRKIKNWLERLGR